MARSADLVECINQGVLVVGLKRNVEVNRGTRGRVTQRHPVGRGGRPCVLHTFIIPKNCKRRGQFPEGNGGKYGENREPVVAHD